MIDAELRKCGEQMRLETSVAHTVNDECFTAYLFKNRYAVYAKCKSTLPGEYCRKAETQKNWLLERPLVERWGLIENNV